MMKKLLFLLTIWSSISCEKRIEVGNVVSFSPDFDKYGEFRHYKYGDEINITFELFSIPDSLKVLYAKRDSLTDVAIEENWKGNKELLLKLIEEEENDQFRYEFERFVSIRIDTFQILDSNYNISFDHIEETDSTFILKNAGIKVVF